jgi:twinkle protein
MSNFNWGKLGIDVTHIRREGKTTCPKCGPTRKNKRDKSLSVNVNTGDYCCHNSPCDFRGNAEERYSDKKPKREYTKPVPRLQQVSDKVAKWFETRGISNNTLLHMKITEAAEWMPQVQREQNCICFNYFREEELINIKFRSADKNFKLAKDAELIFYNLNCLKERKRNSIAIVEGEIDALTLVECGIYGVLSVPNGANQLRPGVAPRLEYLDNCWDDLVSVESFVIATDDDEAGILLKQELIRRIGADRCYTVRYPQGCKDVNEVLTKHGKESVLNMFRLENLTEVPIEGVLRMQDMESDADAIFKFGYPKTMKLGWDLDKYLTWLPGDVTVITGIPNHGKSTWLNNVLVQLSDQHGWRIAVFSPEKARNGFLITEIATIFAGMPVYRSNPNEKMSEDLWHAAKRFVEDHFLFVKTSGIDLTVDGLLDVGTSMMRRYGINALVIDPWNYVETDIPKGQTETVWLGNQLGKVSEWAKESNVHVFVVAHPAKMPKHPKTQKLLVPTLYDISGSAHWNNKIDNGVCVYRNYDDGTTSVYVHKVRWFFVGRGGGQVKMVFDPASQRFSDYNELSQEQQTYEDIKSNQKLRERGREIFEEKQTLEFPKIEDVPF